ncbi:MAG: hypothetical protein M3Q69_12230 [Acidobacteriota bacterium]|nr:hypothetical protein [Acidobacteriota bacterium]
MKLMPLVILAATTGLAGCQVDNRGNVEPAAETKTAAQEIRQGAEQAGAAVQRGAQQVQESDAGKRIAAGAQEAGKGIQQGAGEAAEAAGQALQQAGQEAQQDAKKDAAPPKTQT